MKRRSFLSLAGGTAATASAGCLGETDHRAELEAEIERRGVTVTGTDLDDDLVRVGYESSTETSNDDLAEIAMAFVERIDDGWGIDRLEGVAHADPDLVWYTESAWAREYLGEEIDASEYGARISETIETTLVLDGEDAPTASNDTDD